MKERRTISVCESVDVDVDVDIDIEEYVMIFSTSLRMRN